MLLELEHFALRHDLPKPELAQKADGQHVFLYSQNRDRRYAYSLTWTQGQSHILWVMLNPGTGETENRRRNTFERCKQWSLSMGYGGMIFGNIFSLRSKSAKDLFALGPTSEALNEYALQYLSQLAPETIVAWGNHGAKSNQPKALHRVLSNPKCFGYTKVGQPRHPLYIASQTPLVVWQNTLASPSEA
jgi:hypothetical protein